jgi:hypothetical protein
MFQSYRKNVYSQYGEDGILEELLFRVSKSPIGADFWCCEVGAWDGVFLSNTCNLIRNLGYRGVLIEGDSTRLEQCVSNLGPGNTYLSQFVGLDESSNLNSLLSNTPIPLQFDFLSIDIDGMDYFIFESLNKFSPKIICIEYNPTIPFSVEYTQAPNSSIKHGSSALALLNLGLQKGYCLQAMTRTNLILVSNEVAAELGLPLTRKLEEFKEYIPKTVVLFCGYNGDLLLSDSLGLPWHGLQVNKESLQIIPKWLRRYSGDYNFLQRIGYKTFQKVHMYREYSASHLIRKLFRRITGAAA